MDFDLSEIEEFEWDEGNFEHIKKHKVTYVDCEEIITNRPLLINEDKTHSKLEKRFQALGQTNDGRLLFIAFTIRKNKIRIISAREQNRKEKIQLEKGGEDK